MSTAVTTVPRTLPGNGRKDLQKHVCKTDPGEAVCTGLMPRNVFGKVSSRATVSTLLTSSDGTSESSVEKHLGRGAWTPPTHPSDHLLLLPLLLESSPNLPPEAPSKPSSPETLSEHPSLCFSSWGSLQPRKLPHHYTPRSQDPSRSPLPEAHRARPGCREQCRPGGRVRVHRDGVVSDGPEP